MLLSFPYDDGRHEGYNESWYAYFHLESENGSRYGFNILYILNHEGDTLLKQCSLSDLSNEKLLYNFGKYSTKRFSVDSGKLNITLDAYKTNDRWYQIDDSPVSYYFSVDFPPGTVQDISLDCTMISTKLPLIPPDTTLGIMGEEFLDTHYYAYTNLDVVGTLTINENSIPVIGSAWIDREWGMHLMGNFQWFSLQLDNKYEISANKVFKDGKNETFGLLLTPSGDVHDLSNDLIIKELTFSSDGYVNSFLFSSEEFNMSCYVNASFDDQVISYMQVSGFEGVCTVEGIMNNEKVYGVAVSEQTRKWNIEEIN
jgi:predicted secreted hydrolase